MAFEELLATARPFESGGTWYWGTRDAIPDPDGDEWRLPPQIMDLIDGWHTYPEARRFASEDDAFAALRAAVETYNRLAEQNP
jgi:hypothetical protein